MLSRRAHGERGSVALVMIVAAVLAAVVAMLVTRTISDGRAGRTQQHREAAMALAEVGLANAQAAISQGEDATDVSLRGSHGGDSWAVRLRRVAPDRWELAAVGRSGPSSRGVTAALTRGPTGFRISEWTERPAGRIDI